MSGLMNHVWRWTSVVLVAASCAACPGDDPDPVDAADTPSSADSADVNVDSAQVDGDALADAAPQTPLEVTGPLGPDDFLAPACSDTSPCQDTNAVCRGGGCASQVTSGEFATDVRAGWLHTVATKDDNGDLVGFDLDGDGSVDNGMAALLVVAQSLLGERNVNEELNTMLDRGQVTALVVTRDAGPGKVDVSVVTGTSDIDSDGNPDQSASARRAGSGVFRIDPAAMTEALGPQLTFPGAARSEDAILTTVADFDVAVPLVVERCSLRWHQTPRFADGARCRMEQPMPLKLIGLRAAGTVADVGDAGLSAEAGAVRIGGYLHLDTLAEAMSRSFADNCGCLGIDPQDNAIVTRAEDGGLVLACDRAYTEEDTTNCISAQEQCHNMPTVCDALPMLGQFAEVDTDEDGTRDAISFGMSVALSPAFIDAGTSYTPPAERCETQADEDNDSRSGCDDPECWDDTNCGAQGWGERCHDGFDDNGDGLVDCDDPHCIGNRGCPGD